MIIRRTVPVAVSIGAALALIVSGCSDGEPTDSSGQSTEDAGKPGVTTVDLTLDDQPVDLTGATLKCYDHEDHLMVEAHNADDSDASHFLMDYYRNDVTLSIGVDGGESGVFEFVQGDAGQTATVKRDGDSVSVTGTIEESLSDSATPQPFEITANCAKFFDTPPDSSKVDPSDVPSMPASCPAGEVLCIPDN